MLESPAQPLARFSLAMVGLMWSLPFLQPVHAYPLTSFYSEWLAFALGLVAFVALAEKRVWRNMRVPLVALFPLGLIALLILQCALDRVPYPAQAFTAALYLVWAVLLMLLGNLLRRALGMATVCSVLAWFVLAGGLLSALGALLQHYDIATVLDAMIAKKAASAVFGNLAQPNHFASYATLALVSLAYLFARGSLNRTAVVAAGVPLLLVLALSGSRSAWLYLATVLALVAWLRVRDGNEISVRVLNCIAFLSAGFVLAQWLAALPLLAPEHGLVTSTSQRLFDLPPGPSVRLQLWREAWWMFTQFPMLGAGFGEFAWQHFEYQVMFPGAIVLGPFNHAHNIVLHLLAETGLMGALLIAGGALFWLWGLRLVRLDLEHWWLLGLLAVIGIHSMVELPLWYAYFLGVAAIALGIGATQLVSLRPQRFGHLAALLVLAAGAVNALGVLQGYRSFERLFTESAGALDTPQVSGILLQAQRDPVLEPYAELAASFGIDIERASVRDKLDLNGRVMRFAPIDVVVYRQAMLLAMNNEPQAAQRQFKSAAWIYPDELPGTTVKLRELAGKYPGEFNPLLELAMAKSTDSRKRPGER
jgi:O-antigen ligase